MPHDLLIIGAGPAGLSAATNSASEGLETCVLEAAPAAGGQAATSSRIENYPGFPDGVDGATMAQKFAQQAERLGARIETDAPVYSLTRGESGLWHAGEHVARAVLLANGADYRRLDVPGAAESDAILYGAPAEVHPQYAGRPVAVIGAANSAAQAALNLARFGARVTLLARRTLAAGASAYLVARIAATGGIRVFERTSVAAVEPDPEGAYLITEGAHSGPLFVAAAFAYIGAVPRADFARGVCSLDSSGFVQARDGFATSARGLFVAGDIRAGSRKRVAAAVGEGAQAVAQAWQYVKGEERSR